MTTEKYSCQVKTAIFYQNQFYVEHSCKQSTKLHMISPDRLIAHNMILTSAQYWLGYMTSVELFIDCMLFTDLAADQLNYNSLHMTIVLHNCTNMDWL